MKIHSGYNIINIIQGGIMNIDVNTPIDDLLGTWAIYSQKLFNTILTSKEEMDEFKKIRLTLKTKGVTDLEIHNIYEREYILQYNKHGGKFTKQITLDKYIAI